MSFQGCIRFSLKFANYVLLLIGLTMTIYSVIMFVQFREDEKAKDISPPPPGGLHSPPPPPSNISDIYDYVVASNSTPSPPPAPAPPPSDIFANATVTGKEWFIYGFGAAGAFTTITSSTGIVGAGKGNYCLLTCYTYELILMILGQAALAIALFSDKELYKIPENVTPDETKAVNFIVQHIDIAKWMSLSILLLEAISVGFACSLNNQSSNVDSDDDEDDLRSSRSRPLIRRGGADANQPPQSSYSRIGAGTSAVSPSQNSMRYSTWRDRMREKYGLDTNRYSYDPERSGEPDGHSGGEQSKSSCVIA